MSMLIGHAKAAVILADALRDEAKEMSDKGHGVTALILACMASAHMKAAVRMEQEMRREATGAADQP